MFGRLDISKELDRMGNCHVKLNESLGKLSETKKRSTHEEYFKYLDMEIEGLYSILRFVLGASTYDGEIKSNALLLKDVEKNYLLSDKSVEKITYIMKFHKNLLMDDKEIDNIRDFKKVMEYLDDIIDELRELVGFDR